MNVLVLANSWKLRGRCVAGIDLATGQWVRPVSATSGGELTERQASATSRTVAREVRPLDVVEMRLGPAVPSPHHPEDIVRQARSWAVSGRMRATDVIADHSEHIDRGPDLLGNRSDRITLPAIEGLGTSHRSLTLIRPGHVSFYPTTSMGGNPQLRARFELRGNWYDLSVTDIRYGAQTVPDEGDYLLTVSLGVPFRPGGSNEEACFKIVAGVIQVPS